MERRIAPGIPGANKSLAKINDEILLSSLANQGSNVPQVQAVYHSHARVAVESSSLASLSASLLTSWRSTTRWCAASPIRVSVSGGASRQALMACASALTSPAGTNQPCSPGSDQLRNAGNIGADNWPPKRHGLHQDDRQAFGKTWQHQSPCRQDFLSHASHR